MQQVLDALRPALQDPAKKKLGQHGKYDLHVRRHGVAMQGYHDDTMLESFVLNSTATRHDMDSLALRYLGYSTIKFEDAGKGAKQIPFSQVGIDEASRYAAEDADITLRLHHALQPQLLASRRWTACTATSRCRWCRCWPALKPMACGSTPTNSARARTCPRACWRAAEGHRAGRAQLQPGFAQAAAGGAVRRAEAAGGGEDPEGPAQHHEEALEAIADQHELPRVILDYRGLPSCAAPHRQAAGDGQPGHRPVHTSYHQSGAATGRLSSSDPNLQNIPIRTEDGRRIRRAFIAPEGFQLLAADYSQIELRIMAHLSEDPGLVRAFEQGADVHRATAAEVFGRTLEEVTPNERRAAKAINFGLMYGMSAFGLARNLGIDRGQAQDYVALYFSRYPGVRDFMERMRQQARDQGLRGNPVRPSPVPERHPRPQPGPACRC